MNTHTHAELIDVLGGGTKVCADLAELGATNLDRDNVYTWKYQNHIPWKWRPLIHILAQRAGIEIGSDFLVPTGTGGQSHAKQQSDAA